MSKYIIKNNICIILFILILEPISLFSQNKPNEIEIKRSGKYFWGQSSNSDSVKAKLSARDELMYKISNQYSNANLKADLMVKLIRYYIKPIEDIYKVIAYVPQINVSTIIENKSALIISEIKYTEATVPTISKEVPDKTAPQSIDNLNDVKPETTITNLKEATSVETDLLTRLISCNNASELKKLIKTEVDKNTLVFNWDSKNFQKRVPSDNFYIVLIDPLTNNIIAVLDKGKLERINLKTKQKVVISGYDNQNIIQVWIQLM